MTFAEQIKEAREKAGLTQQEAADRAGVTKSAIEKYERGVRIPHEVMQGELISRLKKAQPKAVR